MIQKELCQRSTIIRKSGKYTNVKTIREEQSFERTERNSSDVSVNVNGSTHPKKVKIRLVYLKWLNVFHESA